MRWANMQPGISHAQRAVLVALASHIDIWGVCFPSHERLSEYAGGMNRTGVIRALNELADRGLIDRQRSKGGKGRSTRYRVGGRFGKQSQGETVSWSGKQSHPETQTVAPYDTK